jgi:2'-5' RNA ligase
MRQFLALSIGEDARRAIAALQAELEPRCAGWRWIPAANVHLTLRFLGDVDPEDDPGHRAAWREAARSSPPVRFDLGGIGVFPSVRRARVLWVGVRDATPAPGLAGLAGALEAAARVEGFDPEERGFRPHLTVARARRGRRVSVPPDDAGVEPVHVEVPELVLYRSDLDPSGARYTELERFPLAG